MPKNSFSTKVSLPYLLEISENWRFSVFWEYKSVALVENGLKKEWVFVLEKNFRGKI